MTLSNKDNPVQSDFYVRLQTNEEMRKDTVKKFYSIVKEKSPNGVVTGFDVLNEAGEPAHSVLVHRVDEEGNHVYEVPLTRNLTPDEIYEIVSPLDYTLNEGDFLFESSTIDDECCPYEDPDDVIESSIYEELATIMSKRAHNKWVDDRVDHGWVLGESRNDENRTHPMLKPWDLLTEEQKAVDYNMPKEMLDLLEEFGYTLIDINELNDLLDD